LRLVACLLLFGVVQIAHAQAAALPSSSDTRLVLFVYDANDTYPILTRPGVVTDIQLAADETLDTLALGDTAQWTVAQSAGHVFVKPVRPDLYTSATLVTTKRVYQLTLRASPENGKWYQRVSWNYPDVLVYHRKEEARRKQQDAEEASRGEQQTVTRGVALEELNFGYAIKGAADFRPTQVLDDGRFTYLRMPARLQELPTVFVVGADGQAELVNTLVRGDYLVVQRLAPRLLLKLGKTEVSVARDTSRLFKSTRNSFQE
jgi:type IV secretion system protein VirB9